MGSKDLLPGTHTPDQVEGTSLVINKLEEGEIRSDLMLDMFVGNIENDATSYVKSRFMEREILSDGTKVDNYHVFINPTSKYAYIKLQTHFGEAKIEMFYDQERILLGEGVASGKTLMVGDKLLLPVTVTAKDGSIMKYTLTIQKALNNTNLKLVEAKVTTSAGELPNTYIATPTGASDYKVDMPLDVELVKFHFVPEDPEAEIKLFKDDGVTLDDTSLTGADGRWTDFFLIKDKSMLTRKIRVIARTGATYSDYTVTAMNIPEGTRLESVELSGEGDVTGTGERIYKHASISGLTSFFGSIPNEDPAHPAKKVWLKLTAENKQATVKANGINIQSEIGRAHV